MSRQYTLAMTPRFNRLTPVHPPVLAAHTELSGTSLDTALKAYINRDGCKAAFASKECIVYVPSFPIRQAQKPSLAVILTIVFSFVALAECIFLAVKVTTISRNQDVYEQTLKEPQPVLGKQDTYASRETNAGSGAPPWVIGRIAKLEQQVRSMRRTPSRGSPPIAVDLVEETNSSNEKTMSEPLSATKPQQPDYMMDFSIPLMAGATVHLNSAGKVDSWLVRRGREESGEAPSRVIPFGSSPLGVVVHSLTDNRNYLVTKTGGWMSSD